VATTAPLLRVVEREFQVYRRLWRGMVFSMFLNPTLFLAAMGVGLGDLIDESSGDVGGVSYLEFVAPGVLVASAMQLVASESLWPVLAGAKWMRFYHGMVSTPLTAADVFGGFVVWQSIRTVLSASVFVAVAALLGAIASPWAVLAVPAAALTAAAFCALIGAFSATQDTDFAFPVIMRLGILPLFLFSGTFFPVSELPDWLEAVARLSPLWHGVELARRATTGDVAFWPMAAHVVFLVACVAAGWIVGTRTFTRRLAS
jgi:lipooligosaccharide transport system permease protein